MNDAKIKKILRGLSSGEITPSRAFEHIRQLPFEDIEFAKIDHYRLLRTGAPEVIFAPGKTADQIIKIAERMIKTGSDVVISRADRNIYKKFHRHYKTALYHEAARMILMKKKKAKSKSGPVGFATNKFVAVVSAGTSDINVSEEAAITIEAFGGRVDRIYDVGVAGIHRLLAFQDKLRKASVVIVIAGMEGALPSVVGGLVAAPIIAVPTSVGYGTSFGGIAALLAMLNSCAPGITVVNIDNGFGAAMAALRILKV
jgi:NCAIR mutase (PurE)-related protein